MTARALFHRCRAAGIVLAADGDSIVADAPDTVAVPTDELRTCKPELLAVLIGDYAKAGLELVLRETTPGEQRQELVEMFDKRLASGMVDDLLNYGQSAKLAYIAIAKEIERIKAATTTEGKAA